MVVGAKVPDKAPADKGSSFNQILGIKGAKQETVSLFINYGFIEFDTEIGGNECCIESGSFLMIFWYFANTRTDNF